MDLPRRLGPFELTRVIGAGGMGIVYEGTLGGAPAAVKVIRAELAEDPEFRARFRHEITLVQRVRSACTARVLAADADGELPYLATEYLPGPTLSQFVRTRGPLSVSSVRTLALGLADALGAIHAAGVIHRDLKPANVILAGDGPRVVDFGIAQAADVTALTRVDMVVGSPGFMSPEQVSGVPVGPAADVFSWACTVAFGATGRSPFGDGPAEAVMFRVRHDPANLAGVPGVLYALLAQALVKDPRRRPAIGEVLGRLLATPSPSVQAVNAMDLDTAAMRVLAAGWPVSSDLAARANSRTQVVSTPARSLPTPPPLPLPTPTPPPPPPVRTPPPSVSLPPSVPLPRTALPSIDRVPRIGPRQVDPPPSGQLPSGPVPTSLVPSAVPVPVPVPVSVPVPSGSQAAGHRRVRSSARPLARRRRWLAWAAIALVTAVVAFGAGMALRLVLADGGDGGRDTGSAKPLRPAASSAPPAPSPRAF